MAKHKKILVRVLSGTADENIAFADLRGLLLRLGFDERIRGDHHNLHARGRAGDFKFTAEKSHGEAVSSETGTSADPALSFGSDR